MIKDLNHEDFKQIGINLIPTKLLEMLAEENPKATFLVTLEDIQITSDNKRQKYKFDAYLTRKEYISYQICKATNKKYIKE